MRCNSCGKIIPETIDYYINSGNGSIHFCLSCVGDRGGASLNDSKGDYLMRRPSVRWVRYQDHAQAAYEIAHDL